MNFCPLDKRCYHSIIIVIWNHQGLLKLLLIPVWWHLSSLLQLPGSSKCPPVEGLSIRPSPRLIIQLHTWQPSWISNKPKFIISKLELFFLKFFNCFDFFQLYWGIIDNMRYLKCRMWYVICIVQEFPLIKLINTSITSHIYLFFFLWWKHLSSTFLANFNPNLTLACLCRLVSPEIFPSWLMLTLFLFQELRAKILYYSHSWQVDFSHMQIQSIKNSHCL